MLVDSLDIRNYRCLGKIELSSLSPITVLVGRNNTGKSTLLEALALVSTGESAWHDALGDDLIEPIIERRGGWNYADMIVKVGAQSSLIRTVGDKISRRLHITTSIMDLSDEIYGDFFSRTVGYTENAILRTVRALARSEEQSEVWRRNITRSLRAKAPEIADSALSGVKVCLEYFEKQSKDAKYAVLPEAALESAIRDGILEALDPFVERHLDRRSYFEISSGRKAPFRSPVRRRSKTVFLLSPTVEYLKELQRRLAKSGDLLNLIELLKKRIKYLKDIREVDGNFLVFTDGLKKPVPLEGMGDGFRAKLTILSAIATIKKGLILMEEPETRLHPGFMGSIAKQIAENAAREDIQFVISTHSLDFLEFLLEENAQLVKVVRMYRGEKDSEIDYETLDGNEAKEELKELEMDLRGI